MTKWAEWEKEFLQENNILTIKQKSEMLNRSIDSIECMIRRLEVNIYKPFQRHDYITLNSMVKDVSDRKLIPNKYLINSFAKSGLIKYIQRGKIKLININHYDKWIKFFETHYIYSEATKKLQENINEYISRGYLYSLIRCKIIIPVNLKKSERFRIWIKKTDINRLIKIFNSTITVYETAKLLNVSVTKLYQALKHINIEYENITRFKRIKKTDIHIIKNYLMEAKQ